jgi:TonB family protein
MSTVQPTGSNQSDLLLWIAGGAIATVGAAWLLITQPWSGGDAEPDVTVARASSPASAPAPAAGAEAAAAATPEASLDNPLRMAELAYAAGMLIEPEEYSAWTLYARVVKAEPDNAVARDGLTKVADDLVQRGETALEQGRFDDARHTVERIRATLPEHAGAKALALKIWPQATPGAPTRAALTPPEPQMPRVARVETAPAAPARPKVDPVAEAGAAFEKAMAEGRLLTPADDSAKHHVGVLATAAADHEITQRARTTLAQEFLSRAAQSIEALDPEAAGIWIDEAESLVGGSHDGVRRARTALTEQLIAMEASKPLPASALKIVTYVAPTYPPRALERSLEGWVDVEFTVGTDGKTRNVVVTDASHESIFRREATDAVGKWQFEPRVFMGRTIEQNSYTRIRFVQ